MDGWFSIYVHNDLESEQSGGRFICQYNLSGSTEVITFKYASAERMDSFQFAKNTSGKFGGSNLIVKTDSDDYEFVCNGTTSRAFMIESVGVVMTSQNCFDNLYGIIGTFIQ